MIHDLKPYPAYKDSGVPWLGEVPAYWDVERAKWLFRKMDRPVRETDEVVTCFRDGVVTLRKNRRVRGFTESLKEIGYQGIRRGDLVIHAMDAFAGAVGVADSDGKGTPVYSVCEPAPSANAHFYAYMVREMARSEWVLALAKGIRERSTDFRFEGFASQAVLLPPLPEQSAIVRFLDHADRRIRRYIRAKKKLIALLTEQKQAIIHRAVTRGLDPNVRLKPSGVEWLSEVPEHWEVRRVKRLARSGAKTFTDGDWIEIPYITAQGVRLIQTGNVGIGEYREKGFRYVSEETFYTLRCTEVEAGDVLICRLDGPVGRACLAPNLGNKMITSVDNVILKVANDVDSRYVVHVMSSPDWLNWIASICRAGGGFRYRISRSMLGNITIPLPPTSEQRAIAHFIQQELDDAAVATRRIRAEIELLHEYRTRLIADVVTGKLDVREAAARLPDEAEEPEPLEEAEAMGEDEEGEGVDLDALSEEAIA